MLGIKVTDYIKAEMSDKIKYKMLDVWLGDTREVQHSSLFTLSHACVSDDCASHSLFPSRFRKRRRPCFQSRTMCRHGAPSTKTKKTSTRSQSTNYSEESSWNVPKKVRTETA